MSRPNGSAPDGDPRGTAADADGPANETPATRIVAIVGAGGQLGTSLVRRAPEGAAVVALARADLDITDAAAVAAHPALAADVVINAAAYTDVDGAETDEARAHLINATAAGHLAERCKTTGAHLIHISTDYVFGDGGPEAGGDADGAASESRPLRVGDPTRPATAYGRTKLAGERLVRDSGAAASIVRTAWVYSGPTQPGTPDFVSTMLSLEERGRPDGTINVVADQHGNPTFADDLADALWELALRPVAGTFHVTGTGATTWHGLAAETFALAGADPARVRPCTSAEFPRPAPRPAWSVLDGNDWRDAGFTPLPGWRDALRRALL